jgi:hypothetical protein
MAIMSIAVSNKVHSGCGLNSLLAALDFCALDFQWYLVEFEAGFFSKVSSSDDHAQEWIRDLCDEGERRRAGVPLPWEKVKALAESMRSPDMTLLIAVRTGYCSAVVAPEHRLAAI